MNILFRIMLTIVTNTNKTFVRRIVQMNIKHMENYFYCFLIQHMRSFRYYFTFSLKHYQSTTLISLLTLLKHLKIWSAFFNKRRNKDYRHGMKSQKTTTEKPSMTTQTKKTAKI